MSSREADPHSSTMAKLSFVGAGPGGIGDLTVSAFLALQEADVVVTDRLVSESVLRAIPSKVEVLVAAKSPNPDAGQDQISGWVRQRLAQGKKVVRLKGGDPAVYGRLAEELVLAESCGLAPEIIPGVTSITAAAAALRLPLNHRGVADKILVATASGMGGTIPLVPPFRTDTTAVFLMCAHNMQRLLQSLLDSGYPAEVPLAIAERAGLATERLVKGYSISSFLMEPLTIAPPAVLFVGYVVAGQ